LGPSVINEFGSKGPVNVLEKPKLAAHSMEQGAPLGVAGGTKLQSDGDVSLHVDGREGTDHVSHGWRRSSGGRGAAVPGHQQIRSVGKRGGNPRKERMVVWQAPKVGRREEGEAP